MLTYLYEGMSEGCRILRRSFRARFKGFRAYSGNHADICRRIIDDCYNKKSQYFMTSNGHFREFFTRDFGMCTQALINLGHEEKVRKTLEYALSAFSRQGKITTQITPSGVAIDSFDYASDSLPFLLRSLRLAKAYDFVEAYKPFLEKEAQRYFENLFDPKKGTIKENKYVSSIKDHYKRNSSCYDNCMLAILSNELNALKLRNPFRKHNFAKIIKKNFWNGSFFEDDLNHEGYVSGDANTFPYYCGIFDDKKMLKKSIAAIRSNELDRPFPLKYTNNRMKNKELLLPRILSPNYEGTAIWNHLGLCYMYIVWKVDKELLRKYLSVYRKNIERYRNFLEVFNPDATPYKSFFYYCDESMLWSAMYLDLLKKLK